MVRHRGGRRLLVVLADEKGGDFVGHLDEQIDIHRGGPLFYWLKVAWRRFQRARRAAIRAREQKAWFLLAKSMPVGAGAFFHLIRCLFIG
jgi:hypothetical protein